MATLATACLLPATFLLADGVAYLGDTGHNWQLEIIIGALFAILATLPLFKPNNKKEN